MTIVRMNVAKSELTFSTPTFAKIAVSAANVADRTAQSCHDCNAERMLHLLMPSYPES